MNKMQRRIKILIQNLNFHFLSLSLPRLGPAQSVSHRAPQLLGPALCRDHCHGWILGWVGMILHPTNKAQWVFLIKPTQKTHNKAKVKKFDIYNFCFHNILIFVYIFSHFNLEKHLVTIFLYRFHN